MRITEQSDPFFSCTYNGKRLFVDSIERTLDGYRLVKAGNVEAGAFHILLARVESAAAYALVAISSVFEVIFFGLFLLYPLLICDISLNLASRLPGISSFKRVQDFTQPSSDRIKQVFNIHLIGIPAISLFLTAAGINTFLPGILKTQNVFSDSIDRMVAPLGELRTIKVTVPGKGSRTGTEDNSFGTLKQSEENLRALSTRNYIQEHVTSYLEYNYTVYR